MTFNWEDIKRSKGALPEEQSVVKLVTPLVNRGSVGRIRGLKKTIGGRDYESTRVEERIGDFIRLDYFK